MKNRHAVLTKLIFLILSFKEEIRYKFIRLLCIMISWRKIDKLGYTAQSIIPAQSLIQSLVYLRMLLNDQICQTKCLKRRALTLLRSLKYWIDSEVESIALEDMVWKESLVQKSSTYWPQIREVTYQLTILIKLEYIWQCLVSKHRLKQ